MNAQKLEERKNVIDRKVDNNMYGQNVLAQQEKKKKENELKIQKIRYQLHSYESGARVYHKRFGEMHFIKEENNIAYFKIGDETRRFVLDQMNIDDITSVENNAHP